jgi:hypothetical protein
MKELDSKYKGIFPIFKNPESFDKLEKSQNSYVASTRGNPKHTDQ